MAGPIKGGLSTGFPDDFPLYPGPEVVVFYAEELSGG